MIHLVGPSPSFFGFLIFGAFKPSGFKVAGKAGPAEARRGASQLLGNRRVPGAGTPGSIAELQGAGWAEMY